MKVNEKWILFLIATFTTFSGIISNFIKVTESKPNEIFDEVVLMDEDETGLIDVVLNNVEFHFDPNMFSYNINVEKIDDLEIVPVLLNDEIDYKMSIIGDKNVDKSLIVIITVNYTFRDSDVYTFYIQEH